ncbi:MAG: SEC-C domain-containing protein [Caulobacteraceae bacterium]|nr:SEC-C domain-containing protein [Caulobacteraceae bacterium]
MNARFTTLSQPSSEQSKGLTAMWRSKAFAQPPTERVSLSFSDRAEKTARWADELVQSAESLLRVGQDLVDNFVWHHDFAGARQFMESTLLPQLAQFKLADYMVTVRSHYAVVLAYCRAFDAADREMARLQPYVPGLPPLQQKELREQTRLIAELKRDGPPPQRPIPSGLPDRFAPMSVPADRTPRSDKVGRNDPCPCGSGKSSRNAACSPPAGAPAWSSRATASGSGCHFDSPQGVAERVAIHGVVPRMAPVAEIVPGV